MCRGWEPCHIDRISIRGYGRDANGAWIDFTFYLQAIQTRRSFMMFYPVAVPASLASWDGKVDWSCPSTLFAFQCISRSENRIVTSSGLHMPHGEGNRTSKHSYLAAGSPVKPYSNLSALPMVSCPHESCLDRSASERRSF